MYISTVTVSSKGQIVLPKQIRNLFKTNTISVAINDDNQVILAPVRDLAGVFSKYKKNTALTFEQIREQAWIENTSHRIKKDKKNIK